MAFKSTDEELRYLRKQNKILKRQIGNLKKELKVDVKALKIECYKQGYLTCENQMQSKT